MAHFRRKKPRIRTFGGRVDKQRLKDRGTWDFWYRGGWIMHDPAWHDTIHHNRKPRRKVAAMERAVMMDWIEPDIAMWPIDGKPREWYW